MGIVDALKNGTIVGRDVVNQNSSVNIKTGNGNNYINVNAGNASVQTGDGNQQIQVNAVNNVSVKTGLFGKDVVVATGKSAFINTCDGDDAISFTGNQFDISAIGGNNTILVKGNTDDKTSQNSITVGDGNQVIRAIGNNVDINAGDANLELGIAGDNLNLTSGKGNNVIGFWGDNVNMSMGDGNNYIQTLDISLRNNNFSDFGFDKIIDKETIVSSKELQVINEETKISKEAAVDEIAKKYNLSDAEKKLLAGLDLNAKAPFDGKPLYVITYSPKKGQNVIARRDSATHMWAVSDNECIATKGWKNDTATATGSQTQTVITENTYFLNGVSNVTIKAGNGDNDIRLTTNTSSKSDININLGDSANGNSIFLQNGFTVKNTEKEVITKETSSTIDIMVNSDGDKTWNSPLIVDFNRDGQVGAAGGQGVDIDNNGKADGAATGGDKMLAMTDMNKNGKIDGQEVFGDQTVNPFTGEKLNAKNGFEALQMVAEAAEKHTGIKCLANGEVDLKALQSALQTVGMNLGFISDDNVTQLEDLAHVAKINVSDYNETEDNNDVAHRQQGSYTAADGTTQKVHDVWFTLK